jgi:hypothetical protein
MSVTRADLKNLKRILIKVGTSVLIHQDGSVALARMGNLVEQIIHLQVRLELRQTKSFFSFVFQKKQFSEQVQWV